MLLCSGADEYLVWSPQFDRLRWKHMRVSIVHITVTVIVSLDVNSLIASRQCAMNPDILLARNIGRIASKGISLIRPLVCLK